MLNTAKVAHKRKRKVIHVRAAKGILSLELSKLGWLKETRFVDVAVLDKDRAPRAAPGAQHGGRCKRPLAHSPSTSTAASQGKVVYFWGIGAINPAASALAPFVDIAQSRAAEHE